MSCTRTLVWRRRHDPTHQTDELALPSLLDDEQPKRKKIELSVMHEGLSTCIIILGVYTFPPTQCQPRHTHTVWILVIVVSKNSDFSKQNSRYDRTAWFRQGLRPTQSFKVISPITSEMRVCGFDHHSSLKGFFFFLSLKEVLGLEYKCYQQTKAFGLSPFLHQRDTTCSSEGLLGWHVLNMLWRTLKRAESRDD